MCTLCIKSQAGSETGVHCECISREHIFYDRCPSTCCGRCCSHAHAAGSKTCNARLLFLHDRMRKFSLCHREDADFQFVVVCACESEGFISNVSSSLGAHMILLLHTCVVCVCMCLSLSHALISTCMLPDA